MNIDGFNLSDRHTTSTGDVMVVSQYLVPAEEDIILQVILQVDNASQQRVIVVADPLVTEEDKELYCYQPSTFCWTDTEYYYECLLDTISKEHIQHSVIDVTMESQHDWETIMDIFVKAAADLYTEDKIKYIPQGGRDTTEINNWKECM